ncbi:MAG: ATP-binding protein [Oscillospiraceae bacterium]|nr:ATP-binding protein [Oscillospiraceae bacterium]
MLCQFSFKNFRSYKDEAVFDLQAVATSKDETKNFKDSLLRDSDGKEFLPVSVIYGPNAGGKSNVIRAFHCVVAIVMNPIYRLKSGIDDKRIPFDCAPFNFDENSAYNPTDFTLFFRPDDEYEYKYFISLKQEKILEENMYRKELKKCSRTLTVFERSKGEITLGSCIRKASINTQINDSLPLLSSLGINYKLEPIDRAISWFKSCVVFNYADYVQEKIKLEQNDEEKQKFLSLINEMGINISDYKIENLPETNSHNISVEHIVNDKSFIMDLIDESEGTKKLFNFFPYALKAISCGGVLMADELEVKLHPKLLKYIIMLFKNPEINTKNAQLVFTSHDISTMKSTVFRTDEIWFACKRADESSDLYSLYEIKDENGNHIQPTAAFDKQYLEGRYGADPYFRNMMD